MNRILLSPPGKKPNKISETGKKNVTTKSTTLYTSNMNLVMEPSSVTNTPKSPKLIKTMTVTNQISGIDKFFLIRKHTPYNVNDNDINLLLKLKYINGDFIIDDKDKDIIIEIIGMLNLYSIDYILDFLTNSPDKQWIFGEQKFMNIGKVSLEREIFINRAEEIGVKGVGKCRYCPGTELVFAQKQVNSGDEPMKVYVRCVTCGQHWKQG